MAKCGRATRKPGSPPCQKDLPVGAVACRLHGGASPQAQRKAAKRVAEQKAAGVFASLLEDPTPVTDPFEALAKIAGEVLAWKELCAGQVAKLAAIRSTDDRGAEQVSALVSLFERAMDRAVATLSAIAKLDIDARLARIEAVKAEALVRCLDVALGEVGLSLPQREQARSVFSKQLRAVG